MKLRVTALFVVLALLLSLCGCSFVEIGVDSRLRAPHAAGEQSAIQTALEQHIYAAGNNASVSYVLKYPQMGEYRSAFVMKDMTGDGVEEALAFYALQPEGGMTHIALLSKQNGVWSCVDDVEGLATEIERIQFGDLDGDGASELFAGFSMYNTRDRRLMMYVWSEDHFVQRYSDTYTDMIVEKLVSEEQDDLLLFRLNATDSRSTVTLLTMQDDTVTEKGSASLDGNILRFGDCTLSVYEDGTRLLFRDCLKDNNTLVTELILWDGKQLITPLYDPTENLTTASARESALPAMDIDSDGITDWPQSFRMPGYELVPTQDMVLWMSEWFTWDPVRMAAVPVMTNIVNAEDGYFLEIPEQWVGYVTADYDPDMRRLTVYEMADGQRADMLLEIVAFGADEDNPFEYEEGYLFLEATEKMRYEMRYNKESEYELTMEQLSPLFRLCEIDG